MLGRGKKVEARMGGEQKGGMRREIGEGYNGGDRGGKKRWEEGEGRRDRLLG